MKISLVNIFNVELNSVTNAKNMGSRRTASVLTDQIEIYILTIQFLMILCILTIILFSMLSIKQQNSKQRDISRAYRLVL